MLRDQPSLKAGDVVKDRYRIVRLLGGGGMGVVYLAEDLRVHGRKRALKEMRHSADSGQFAEEARVLSRLSHPGLPQIVDALEPEGESSGYIVMDYIEGETLTALFMRSGRRLPLKLVLSIGKQICDMFIYLHEELESPVVYRDLKPDNLLVDAQGRIRLIDFGIARFLRPGRGEDTVRLGTPGFAAPEQYAGKSGIRSDLYNLGALLYYLLSGGRHPDGRRRGGLFDDGFSGGGLSGRGPAGNEKDDGGMEGVPEPVRAVVNKLLAIRPEQRYASAREVLAELERLEKEWSGQGESAAGGHAVSGTPGNAHPLTIAVGALYRGAGATFVCESLAWVLARNRVRAVTVDGQGILAKLSERDRPFLNYMGSAKEDVLNTFAIERGAGKDARMSWAHAGGNAAGSGLDADGVAAVIIVDIGSGWHEYSGQNEPPAWADLIVLAADPLPAGWNTTVTERKLRKADMWRKRGAAVLWIANRDVPVKGRGEWLRAFPWKPGCIIPNLEFVWAVEAAWRGKRLQDHPSAAPLLDQALKPLVKIIVRMLRKTCPVNRFDSFHGINWLDLFYKN